MGVLLFKFVKLDLIGFDLIGFRKIVLFWFFGDFLNIVGYVFDIRESTFVFCFCFDCSTSEAIFELIVDRNFWLVIFYTILKVAL